MQIDAKDKLYEEYNALSVNNITLSLCTNLLVSKEEYAAGSTSRHRLKNFTCFLQTKSSLTLGFFSFSVSILLYYGFPVWRPPKDRKCSSCKQHWGIGGNKRVDWAWQPQATQVRCFCRYATCDDFVNHWTAGDNTSTRKRNFRGHYSPLLIIKQYRPSMDWGKGLSTLATWWTRKNVSLDHGNHESWIEMCTQAVSYSHYILCISLIIYLRYSQ